MFILTNHRFLRNIGNRDSSNTDGFTPSTGIPMKQTATRLLRKLHLLSFADRLRFLASAAQYRRHNKRFVAGHRDIVLPPPYMLYESFGKLDYRAYYEGGRESATRIVDMLKKHADLTNARVCEWGCGPARLLRHVPDLLGPERCTV